MKLGMLACCVVMLVPVVVSFVIGGSVPFLGDGVTAFLPILGCLAIHGAMFAVLGRSCRDAGTRDDEASTNVPVVRRPVKGSAAGVS